MNQFTAVKRRPYESNMHTEEREVIYRSFKQTITALTGTLQLPLC
jgi:hypothetical protein